MLIEQEQLKHFSEKIEETDEPKIPERTDDKETEINQNVHIINLLEHLNDKVDDRVITIDIVNALLANQASLNGLTGHQNNIKNYLIEGFKEIETEVNNLSRFMRHFKKVLFGTVTITFIAAYIIGSQHLTIKPYFNNIVEWAFKVKE